MKPAAANVGGALTGGGCISLRRTRSGGGSVAAAVGMRARLRVRATCRYCRPPHACRLACMQACMVRARIERRISRRLGRRARIKSGKERCSAGVG
eukprot:2077-Chlamydomonas_euryale.AAC.1